MQRQYIVKIIGNVSDWLSYAGGALIKVADSAGSTVVARTCSPTTLSKKQNNVLKLRLSWLLCISACQKPPKIGFL